MAKIIAVVGATGAQGGGLARAITADPGSGFTARAITRDPSKDKAKALAAAGAEVVSANLDNVESLKKAFAGAHGVFAVTNFWEHFSGEKEIAQAKNIAEAAKAAGVKHVIWSTLEDTRKLMAADDTRMPILQDKYRVPHFDAKAEADASFAGLPVTYLMTSFYWDNLYMFGLAPKKDDKGVTAGRSRWATPSCAGIAAEDIGKVASASSRPALSTSARPSGSPARPQLPGDEQEAREHRHRAGAVQRRRCRPVRELRLPRRRRDRQHVPGLSRLREAGDGGPEHDEAHGSSIRRSRASTSGWRRTSPARRLPIQRPQAPPNA